MFNQIFPISFKHSALVWLPFTLMVIVLDQFTKYLAVTQLQLGSSIKIFSWFDLVLVHNYGAAFGFLNQGKSWQIVLLVVVAIIATLGFFIWLARIARSNYFEGVGIALLIGGAIGNLIDRFIHGYVIDFLDIYISTWHWPAFNLADSFICIGAGLVLLQLFVVNKNT